jgi:hypothetical protein
MGLNFRKRSGKIANGSRLVVEGQVTTGQKVFPNTFNQKSNPYDLTKEQRELYILQNIASNTTPTPSNTPIPTPTPTSTPIPLSAFTVTLLEVGSDVVMSGYGGFNITDLTLVSSGGGYSSGIDAQSAIFLIGGTFLSSLDIYTGSTFSQPSNFGGPATGFTTNIDSGSMMGVNPANNLAVPTGYVSGTYITGSTTYLNQTLSSLGAVPGTYIYSWGSGANVSQLTLQIGP